MEHTTLDRACTPVYLTDVHTEDAREGELASPRQLDDAGACPGGEGRGVAVRAYHERDVVRSRGRSQGEVSVAFECDGRRI